MKKFSTYQYIPDTPMTNRDKMEIGSKFWNEGKWNNFIVPFLTKEGCGDMTLVDMGCNAGLFLKLAEEWGFDREIGVEADKEAIRRGLIYRDKVNGTYDIQRRKMERSIDKMPIADYTLLINSHYYFDISDWLDYLNKLRFKTRYCIIVTGKKRVFKDKASADPKDVKWYFRDWELIDSIKNVSKENEAYPRDLVAMCFKSHYLKRTDIKQLDNGNNQQRDFYKQLDKNVPIQKTDYYRRMKSYRLKEHNWNKIQLDKYMRSRVTLFDSIKKNGMIHPITINSTLRVIDGNHRCEIMKYLGHKSILVRRVL